MINTIVLRDPDDLDNLYPFSILHPSYEMFSGCLHNFARWQLILPDTQICFESDNLRLSSFLLRFNLYNSSYNENVLFIDGNIIPDFLLIEEIKEAILKNHHLTLILIIMAKVLHNLFVIPKNLLILSITISI